MTLHPLAALPLVVLAVAATGCGSGARSSSSTSSASHGRGASSPHSTGSPAGTGPLTAEAQTAATGDIPDTQVFLRFSNTQVGYSVKYPEGWTRKGAGTDVSFSDKNNIVHLLVTRDGTPSTASVSAELSRAKTVDASLTFRPPQTVRLSQAGAAVRATYTTRSAPNAVTGKRVVLVVDRYEFEHRGHRVTVDLGTPRGVDNVDAYRLMINSFTWR